MKENRSKDLPTFESVDELVAFFETHDMGEYWEKLPNTRVQVSLKQRVKGFSTNTGKRWTPTQVKQLRQLASQNMPTRVIGPKVGTDGKRRKNKS